MKKMLILATVLAMSMLGTAQALQWDVSTDFSLAANPNGDWSYGWFDATTAPATFTLYNSVNTAVSVGGNTFSGHVMNSNWDAWGNIGMNLGPNPIEDFTSYREVGAIIGGPSGNGITNAARWTAPALGAYQVTATFTGAGTSVDGSNYTASILNNGVLEWNAGVVGFVGRAVNGFTDAVGPTPSQSYSGSLILDIGETLDFATTIALSTLPFGMDIQIVEVPLMVNVQVTNGSTAVTEGGNTDTYSIVLLSQPTASVTVTADPNNPSDPNDIFQLNLGAGNGQAKDIIFTPANWNVPQVVTVTAIDDNLIEGPHSKLIRHLVTSSDLNFNGSPAKKILVAITDNDTPSLLINETAGDTQVRESNLLATDSYGVTIQIAPTAPVTIDLTTPDSQVTVNPAQLIFNAGNFSVAQSVVVTAIDDPNLEVYQHSGQILHTATSADALYNGVTNTLTVIVFDNECGAWGFSLVDWNADCVVDLADLGMLAADWMKCTIPDGAGCANVLP